jgi:hypothetical protein
MNNIVDMHIQYDNNEFKKLDINILNEYTQN